MNSGLQRWIAILSLLALITMLAVMAFGRFGILLMVGILILLVVAVGVLEYVWVIHPKVWYRWYHYPRVKPVFALFALVVGRPALPPLPKDPPPEPILKTRPDFASAAWTLGEEVCGQERVIGHFRRCLETAVELRNARADQALGIFLFVGGEGIGKRFLAFLTNTLLFRGKGGWLEIDCNDGQAGARSLAYLLGNLQTPSALVTTLRAHPYTTFLLQNVDAVAPPMLKVLEQLLRGGSYVDPMGGGRVSFQNCLFVLTTGKGWADLLPIWDRLRPDETDNPAVKQEWSDEAHQLLTNQAGLDPLFLSRLNEIFCFTPPSRGVKIAVIQKLMKRECQRHGLVLEWVDPKFVAKPVAMVTPELGFGPLVGHVERLLRDEIRRALDQGRRSLSLHYVEHRPSVQ